MTATSVAQGDLAGDDEPASCPEDNQGAGAGDGADKGVKEAERKSEVEVPLQVLAVFGGEAGGLEGFLIVGFHDPDTREVFLGGGIEAGVLHLHGEIALVVETGGIVHETGHDGHGDEGEEGETGVQEDHGGEGEEKGDGGVGEVHDPRADGHPDRLAVRGGAGHDVGGGDRLEEGGRQREEVPEDDVAEVVLDVS